MKKNKLMNMRYSLMVVILLCLSWNAKAQRLLILDDEFSQCTRVRLADFRDLYWDAPSISNYYEVFAKQPDGIRLAYHELCNRIVEGVGYLPIEHSLGEDTSKTSKYYFIEFSNTDTIIKYEFVIKISISTEPPYKYEQIEYIDIEDHGNLKDQIDELVKREFANKYPLPPTPPVPPNRHFSLTPSNNFDCYNFPRVLFFEKNRNGTSEREGLFALRNYQDLDSKIIANWAEYQNLFNEVVWLYLFDNSVMVDSRFSSFDSLKVMIRTDSIEKHTGIGELLNIKELRLVIDTEVDSLTLPVYISKLEELELLEVKIIRKRGVKGVTGIILPHEVLVLPKLRTIRMASVWRSYIINYKDLNRYYSISGSVGTGWNVVDVYLRKR